MPSAHKRTLAMASLSVPVELRPVLVRRQPDDARYPERLKLLTSHRIIWQIQKETPRT